MTSTIAGPPVHRLPGGEQPLDDPHLQIRRQMTLPADLPGLADIAHAEGYGFIDRLRRDWEQGRVCMTAPGAAFFGCRCGRALVGVCGLQPDAAGTAVGRLDHLYVHPAWRGHGVGRALVRRVVAAATGRYDLLRLRTDTDEAAAFYERLGFRRLHVPADATHELELAPARPRPLRPPVRRPI